MTVTELSRIKKYQREFERDFGKKLHIDWVLIKDLRKPEPVEELDLETLLDECIEINNASRDVIDSGQKLSVKKTPRERKAIMDFCKKVIRLNANYDDAARLINRDRSLIYYYGKM